MQPSAVLNASMHSCSDERSISVSAAMPVRIKSKKAAVSDDVSFISSNVISKMSISSDVTVTLNVLLPMISVFMRMNILC